MKRLYCLKDLKAGAFIMLKVADNSGEYIKEIAKSKIEDYENYEVYFVGEFDSATGYLLSFKFPFRNLKEEMEFLKCL